MRVFAGDLIAAVEAVKVMERQCSEADGRPFGSGVVEILDNGGVQTAITLRHCWGPYETEVSLREVPAEKGSTPGGNLDQGRLP